MRTVRVPPRIVPALLAATLVLACSDDPVGPDPATVVASVSVTPDPVSVEVFDSVRAQVRVLSRAGTEIVGLPVTWTVESDEIAGVTVDGQVIGKRIGATTLTVDVGTHAATVSVDVSSPPVTVETSVDSLEMAIGGTARVDAVARDGEGRVVPGHVFTWRSYDPHVASVTGDGELTALAEGTADVLVQTDNHFGRWVRVDVTGSGYVRVGVSFRHTCAIAGDERAYCWGDPSRGRLGDGGVGLSSVSRPTPVAGDLRFSRIALGEHHTCAVTTDGRGYCWGWNGAGALGVGEGVDQSREPLLVPLEETLVDISTGEDHTCAVTVDGDAYCWGRNFLGQLGTTDAFDCADGPCVVWTPVRVADSPPLRAVSLGGWTNTCGLAKDGAVYCWGARWLLGTDATDERCTAEACPVPVRVASDARFTSVSVGYRQACALDSEGGVHCWGLEFAELPTPIPAEEPLVRLGPSYISERTCGVSEKGRGYCFERDRGLVLTELAGPPAGGWTSVASSSYSDVGTCGIASTGLLYCWNGRPLTEAPERVPDPD